MEWRERCERNTVEGTMWRERCGGMLYIERCERNAVEECRGGMLWRERCERNAVEGTMWREHCERNAVEECCVGNAVKGTMRREHCGGIDVEGTMWRELCAWCVTSVVCAAHLLFQALVHVDAPVPVLFVAWRAHALVASLRVHTLLLQSKKFGGEKSCDTL